MGALISNPILIAVLVGLVCYFIMAAIFKKDEQIESRRSNALRIANELRSEGLEFVPEMLETYAVGNYSGMVDKATSWLNYLKDDETRKAFFAKFRRRQLERAMADDVMRAEVLQRVEQWQAVEQMKKEKFIAELSSRGEIAPAPKS